jgi:uncharacterized protein (TIGR02996 family)
VTTEEDFRQQLAANPTDRHTRLVFADWLDEPEQSRHVDAALQRVLAEPQEDRHRLAFADACDAEANRLRAGMAFVLPETRLGQLDALWKRAEFVRVQVELAKRREGIPAGTPINEPVSWLTIMSLKKPEPNVMSYKQLRRRERELLEAGFLRHLAGPFWKRGEDKYGWSVGDERERQRFTCTARRGFAESITASAADWLTHGDAILAAHPVGQVTLTDIPALEQSAADRDGYEMNLPGRKTKLRFQWETFTSDILLALLGAEWPAIKFAVPRYGSPVPS